MAVFRLGFGALNGPSSLWNFECVCVCVCVFCKVPMIVMFLNIVNHLFPNRVWVRICACVFGDARTCVC